MDVDVLHQLHCAVCDPLNASPNIYHVIQAYRLGCSRAELEEGLNIALIIGGSIVVPHLRRAYALLAELYG